MGNYFIEKLKLIKEKYSFISEVRGKGMMIGIQVSTGNAKEIKDKCFEKGYLVGNVGGSILRLLPPLILTKQDIDDMVDMLDGVLAEEQLAMEN
jgi:acetylornithine aminotransferase/acetylornithine/N-succinyldiaminopimelate aminotransferase